MADVNFVLDDNDAERLREAAHAAGVSVEQLITSFVRDGLIVRKSQPIAAAEVKAKADYAERRRRGQPKTRTLGIFGEEMAMKLLNNYQENGKNVFRNVIDLNYPTKNEKYADIFAEKVSGESLERLIISVKTRNKYETVFDAVRNLYVQKLDRHGKPKLNAKYNILEKAQAHAKERESHHRAKAAWVAVQVDALKNTYSCYFGYLDERTRKRNGIDMNPENTAGYLCLGHEIPADIDIRRLHNEG